MAPPDTLPPPPRLDDLLAQGPVALFLDFDGTLIELAHEPGAIVVPEELVERLHRLRDRLGGRFALVTGRALDDLEVHVAGCAFARAGSHGASCVRADGTRLGEEPGPLPGAALTAMHEFARERELIYESKPHGGAMHFRAMPGAEEAARDLAHSLADEHGLDVKAGKGVVELVNRGASKAAAVGLFMGEPPFVGSLPVFVGDDVTDEDGFVAASEAGGFGIAVGERHSETARFWLRDVTALHRWLGL